MDSRGKELLQGEKAVNVSHSTHITKEQREKVSTQQPRKELENLPHIRDGMVRFEEWSDRPVIIVDRETRLSKPDASGRRNPYIVWLVDMGNELIYSYPPGGNTDAQLKHLMATNGGQPVKCVITPIPNQAGYMSYKWYDWTEQDTVDFMNMKELEHGTSEQESDDGIPF